MLRTTVILEICSGDSVSMVNSLLLKEMSVLYQTCFPPFPPAELGGFGGSWGEN